MTAAERCGGGVRRRNGERFAPVEREARGKISLDQGFAGLSEKDEVLAPVAAKDDGAPARVDRERIDEREATLSYEPPGPGGKPRPAGEGGRGADESDDHEKSKENA